jgi:hypothetical protein
LRHFVSLIREIRMTIEDNRPVKPTQRTHCVSVRLNADEVAQLDAKRGQRPSGQWLRNAALHGLPPVIPTENLTAHRELARIKTNAQTIAQEVFIEAAAVFNGRDWPAQVELDQSLHALRAQLIGATAQGNDCATIDVSKAKRPGRRKLDDARTNNVAVRLSGTELATLDAKRGPAARGEWIRMAALHQAAPTAPPINPQAWAACALAGREVHALVFRMDELLEEDRYNRSDVAFHTVNRALTNLTSAISEVLA